jgi:hypothetical protein
MRKEPSHPQADEDQRYNGSDDSDQARVAEKLNVIIPVQLPEFDTGTARALLHLIIEAHRRKTLNSEKSTEDM